MQAPNSLSLDFRKSRPWKIPWQSDCERSVDPITILQKPHASLNRTLRALKIAASPLTYAFFAETTDNLTKSLGKDVSLQAYHQIN